MWFPKLLHNLILRLMMLAGIFIFSSGAVSAQLNHCGDMGGALSSREIAEQFSRAKLNGITSSGKPWTIEIGALSAPGTQTSAAFTTSTGKTTEGLWVVNEGRFCQSYDDAQNWVCHRIVHCLGRDGAFGMIDGAGTITSTILSVKKRSLASPPPLCQSPGQPLPAEVLNRWLTGRSITTATVTGVTETLALEPGGHGSAYYNGSETRIAWHMESNRFCVNYIPSVGYTCRSIAPCQSGEAPHVTFGPDGSQFDLVLEVYDLTQKRAVPPDELATVPSGATNTAVEDDMILSGETGPERFGSGEPALDQYLATQVPAHWTIDELRFKLFPDQTGSAGRLSLAGTLRLTERLVGPRDRTGGLITSLERRGVAPAVTEMVLDRAYRGQIIEYDTDQYPGNTLPLRAELAYVDTVDGLEIRGDLGIGFGPGIAVRDVPPEGYVVGSEAHEALVVEIGARAQLAQDQMMRALNDTFASYAGSGLAMARMSTPFMLTGPLAMPPDALQRFSYETVGTQKLLLFRMPVSLNANDEFRRLYRYYPDAIAASSAPFPGQLTIGLPWNVQGARDVGMSLRASVPGTQDPDVQGPLFYDATSDAYSKIRIPGAETGFLLSVKRP